MSQILEQSIHIKATATVVERCFTDLALMKHWLNPILLCEPMGEVWSTNLGSESLFIIKIPLLRPSLKSVVVEREPGLVVWEFQGFFRGRNSWECQPMENGTLLLNRFEFQVPNPLINWGFQTFAATWTKEDMQAQLIRLKQVAERLK